MATKKPKGYDCILIVKSGRTTETKTWTCATRAEAVREVKKLVTETKGHGEVSSADPSKHPRVDVHFDWVRGKLSTTDFSS